MHKRRFKETQKQLLNKMYYGCSAIQYKYKPESDILGPIDHFSDINNLVLFERALFENYSFKNRIKIFQLFMSISPH